MPKKKKIEAQTEQSLMGEYAAGNSIYLTYDGFRWQAGSFLIAGVFVYWGFLITEKADVSLTAISALFIAALMSCWLFFANHYRQLYMYKLLRLHEIERALSMEQHRRFMPGAPSGIYHRAHGLKGHTIDAFVYALTTLGSGAIAWVKFGDKAIDSLTLLALLTMGVLVKVRYNEVRLQRDIRAWRAAQER